MGRALKTFKGDLEKRLEKYGREGFVIETVTIKHNTRELAENPRTYITIRLSKYLGNDILGVPIKGYQSKDECMANNDICQQYSKEKCIKQTKCGYCSYKNKGMCLSATPNGPKNLDYKCQQSGSKSNRFTMGQPDEHIPPNINVDKYPFTLPHPNIASDYNLSPMI